MNAKLMALKVKDKENWSDWQWQMQNRETLISAAPLCVKYVRNAGQKMSRSACGNWWVLRRSLSALYPKETNARPEGLNVKDEVHGH
ncbi:MAG: hypothetical protein ACYC0Q_08180 [Eubacteriales bacterium]